MTNTTPLKRTPGSAIGTVESHCSLCGRPVNRFQSPDGYSTCCNETICNGGVNYCTRKNEH
jgi:hypothetical protein